MHNIVLIRPPKQAEDLVSHFLECYREYKKSNCDCPCETYFHLYSTEEAFLISFERASVVLLNGAIDSVINVNCKKQKLKSEICNSIRVLDCLLYTTLSTTSFNSKSIITLDCGSYRMHLVSMIMQCLYVTCVQCRESH